MLKDCRIPDGTYDVQPYSGTKYKDVWHVQNVPGRTAILIHWGNFERNTEGCILLGIGAGFSEGEGPAVWQSKKAIEYFRTLVGNEDFTLTIR